MPNPAHGSSLFSPVLAGRTVARGSLFARRAPGPSPKGLSGWFES